MTWDIDKGITDPVSFFQLLGELFPTATHLYVEGTSITRNVAAVYARYEDPGPYLPGRDTIWPASRTYRCRLGPALLAELALLGASHAQPELADHLSVYDGTRPLLRWHDAFANALIVASDVPETTVATLAGHYGVPYCRS